MRERDRGVLGVAGTLEVERLDFLHGGRDGLEIELGDRFFVIADASLVQCSGQERGGAEQRKGGLSAAGDS